MRQQRVQCHQEIQVKAVKAHCLLLLADQAGTPTASRRACLRIAAHFVSPDQDCCQGDAIEP
jgi:hypothetical protein